MAFEWTQDNVTDAYARLNMHQFVILQMMAHWMAHRPDEEIAAFERHARMIWISKPADDALLEALMIDSEKYLREFMQSLRRLVAEIRAENGGGKPN